MTQEQDWTIDVSQRICRLPPYLFARINNLRDSKRREGVDIIDLGMGNPHDAPPSQVIEKLCEKAHDPRLHGYSQSIGLPSKLGLESFSPSRTNLRYAFLATSRSIVSK